jgi:hypothetical protein
MFSVQPHRRVTRAAGDPHGQEPQPVESARAAAALGHSPWTDVIPRNQIEPMRFRLRLVHKSAWYVELKGEDDITVGCSDATIRIPALGGVSRVHLRLFHNHGMWSFENLSANGVHELDSHGIDTGQQVQGLDDWSPGRGYRIGMTELWMELLPSSERVRDGFFGLIGESEAIQAVHKLIKRVGPRYATVVLHGPSGSGKDLVAAAIHKLSARSVHDLHAVNCAQIRGDFAPSSFPFRRSFSR